MANEGLKSNKELPEVKKKKTNPDRINMTYDEAVADNRKLRELEARKAALDKEFEEEGAKESKKKAPKKSKAVEEAKTETSETSEEV